MESSLACTDYWNFSGTRKRSSPSKNGYHGPYFKATQGTTQGGLTPHPPLFNLIVKNVTRNWLAMTVDYQLVAHKGLRLAVGRCM